MIKYLLDTNVLLRFLRGDHAQHSPAARGLFSDACDGKCVLILTEVALAEAVWVLDSFYQTEREQIAEGLRKVIISAGVHMKCSMLCSALLRQNAISWIAIWPPSLRHPAIIWRHLIGILTALTMSNAGSSNGDRCERTAKRDNQNIERSQVVYG